MLTFSSGNFLEEQIGWVSEVARDGSLNKKESPTECRKVPKEGLLHAFLDVAHTMHSRRTLKCVADDFTACGLEHVLLTVE